MPPDHQRPPAGPPSAATGGPPTATLEREHDLDHVARRALDFGRRTALGVLAGDHATADDVAQEVAIQAVRHAGRIRDPHALDAWLHRTAVRAALRSVRRGRRRRAVEADHVALRVPPGDDAPAVDDLGRLLVGLPERQRAALTLRYVHDLDDDAIAAAIGCRAGTVRALLSRGRGALRERLEDRHAGDPSADAPTRAVPAGDEPTTNATTTPGDPHV